MRETRLSGSEGGGARTRSPYPYPRQGEGERCSKATSDGSRCKAAAATVR
jgi:hypothetical protein